MNVMCWILRGYEVSEEGSGGVTTIAKEDIVLEDVGSDGYSQLHGWVEQPVVLFGQQRFADGTDKRLGLQVSKSVELDELIGGLNEYISFLADARTRLEQRYKAEFQNFLDDYYEGELPANWYETLELYGATIFVTKNGEFGIGVTFGDCVITDHLLEVEFAGQDIVQMYLDG